MLRATLKSLLARKLRLILSTLAVVLSVMFVSGSLVLTDTLGRTFDNVFSNIYSSTDVQVTAKSETANDASGNPAVALPLPAADVARSPRSTGCARRPARCSSPAPGSSARTARSWSTSPGSSAAAGTARTTRPS